MASKKAPKEVETEPKKARRRLVRDSDVLMALASAQNPTAAVNAVVRLDPRAQLLKRLAASLPNEQRSILRQAMATLGYRLNGEIVRVGKKGRVSMDLGAHFKPGTALVLTVGENSVTLTA